jgi:hypothetical protein
MHHDPDNKLMMQQENKACDDENISCYEGDYIAPRGNVLKASGTANQGSNSTVGGVDKRAFVNTSSAPTKRTRSSTDTSSFSTDRHQRDLI